MTAPDGYTLVSLDRARGAEMIGISSWAFTGDVREQDLDIYLDGMPFERAFAMEVTDTAHGERGSLAGVGAAYTFTMRVPGGAQAPVGGLTWVGVHPGHRRRGLLRAMMTAHLREVRDRGEVASVLYAAESEIYQRFGYGLAAFQADLSLPRGATLRDVAGSDGLRVRLELLDAGRHAELLADVQARLERPGTMSLEDPAALRSRFHDPSIEWEREERRRIAIVEDASGSPLAYALFRRAGKWEESDMPNGTVHVFQHAALTPAARHRLWSVLTDLDLMGTVKAMPFAIDDPLLHLVTDARATQARVRDNLWLRIVDVAGALSARGYLTDVDAVIEVTDDLLPDNAGAWRLTSRGGAVAVERAEPADAAISLGIADLSAAYLGGASLTALHEAGRVTERRDGAVAALSTAFGSHHAPVCNLFF